MRKLTHDEQVTAIAKVNPNVEVLEEIKGNGVKVLCRCAICQYEWGATPAGLKTKHGCPKCAGKMKLSHTEQVEAIKKVNPDVEVLGEITNNKTKVLCLCKICGHEWEARPHSLKQGEGCPVCAKIKRTDAKRKTHAEHVADIKKVNPDVEILEEIKSTKKKVLCRCKICGHEWKPIPDSLKRGCGCPECGKIKVANKLQLTHAEHVAAINKINPNIEVLGEITRSDKKVLCRCKVCSHEWETTPSNLKTGRGCPGCKKIKTGIAKRLTHAEHFAAINKINPNVEVLGKITGNAIKVLCRCKVCSHEWKARPNTLKRGTGCPKCAKTGFLAHDVGKLYVMVDDLNVPTMMKIGVSVREDRSKQVLKSARKAGVFIPALHVAKTWEGPTKLMMRIESMMHDNYKEWNIKFPAKFDGCTEFFYYTPETAGVFDVIEETLHEIINANQAA